MRVLSNLIGYLCGASLLLAIPCFAEQETNSKIPTELQGIGITEHLGDQISIADKDSFHFTDDTGKPVHLSKYFNRGKPIILALVYYRCPNLCNFLLNGLTKSLKKLDWTIGEKFEIVNVSINPVETPDLAKAKKDAYIKDYGRPEGAAGWHFLTGNEPDIEKLAAEVGFNYRYDMNEKEYAHSAAIFILTPDGKISRYLYGIEFQQKDLRLGLLEASNGKIGTMVERLLLFCYRYDPQTRKYSVYLSKVMKAGCAGMIVIFGGYLAIFWRRERRMLNMKEPKENV